MSNVTATVISADAECVAMALVGLLKSTAPFTKVRLVKDKAVTDNVVFQLHYRFTTGILFVFCILCTASNLIGKAIDCISGPEFKDREKVINSYCWITSTFTLPYQLDKPVGTHVAAPGIGPFVPDENDTVYHAYYQWVPFVLFFQGLLFYAPHWLWKNWEHGKMKSITKDLRENTLEVSQSMKDRKQLLVTYLISYMRYHHFYAFVYLLCELLNFANVVGNIFFIDKFLGNTFLNYGLEVLNNIGKNQEERTDPMIAIFPRLTKCTLNLYGVSGTITNKDFLCVLPQNILNEKIYIFLWFWFIILSVLSGLAVLYSIVLAVFPPLRRLILTKFLDYTSTLSPIIENTEVSLHQSD
ncbi:hypothetical protein ANN_08434 [Periplaneta americana]|uniref:Innexin n=1 Tax=Periplaneta americana TaxID=6978 RepID=A0ABQ8T3M7_PERAM|nr:hypothetical protein ANN_08434 [Periplaneta americana]